MPDEPIIVTKLIEKIDDRATGEKMRALRHAAGVSLRPLAVIMGVSRAYVSDLELGRRGWNEERAQSYIRALEKAKSL